MDELYIHRFWWEIMNFWNVRYCCPWKTATIEAERDVFDVFLNHRNIYIWIHQLPKSVGKLVVEKDGQFRITFKITSIIVATTLLQSPKTTQEGQVFAKITGPCFKLNLFYVFLLGIDLQSSENKGNGANKLWQHKKTQNHHENRHFSTRRHPKFLEIWSSKNHPKLKNPKMLANCWELGFWKNVLKLYLVCEVASLRIIQPVRFLRISEVQPTWTVATKRIAQFFLSWETSVEQLHPRKLTCPLKSDYFNQENTSEPTIDFSGEKRDIRSFSGG